MHENRSFTFHVSLADTDKRLDLLTADLLKDCSRNRTASLIRQGSIRVAGSIKKPGYRVKEGDIITGEVPEPVPVDLQPETLHCPVLFEDGNIIVVDKPAGMVVHPAPGHTRGTLVHGLIGHCPDLSGIGGEMRPGIVHRLDKDTSGVLVVSKTQEAHNRLSRQFKERALSKKYLAIVHGRMQNESGEIDLPIGRHPSDRKKMSVYTRSPRSAWTRWQVKELFADFSLLEIKIKTGRTHQIRVHCSALHHPIVGDPVYGGKAGRTYRKKDAYRLIKPIKRQMLHAWELGLNHPTTREYMVFQAPIPQDMAELLEGLRELE